MTASVNERNLSPEGRSRRVAVIGAGPSRLAAAYDLGRAGHQVVIYEASPEVGGLAAGFKAPG